MASSSSATTGEKKMLTLKTCDNKEFSVAESLVLQSELIKTMVKEERVSSIPLPTIKSKTLVKIIEYLKKHAELTATSNKEDFKNFQKEFVNVVLEELLDLTVAVNYLKINGLLEFCCQAVADRIKNKSVEAVRKIFRIESDFTPEEEAEFRRETPWAFEGDLDDTTN
ncbi:PREDICTED: SKP1-like protein 11 [Nicotiana attenuata]|uniref:SKP1-like protein n=1 Tax=Nicotiana attenuata TaxID=49451 RepID=A0A1J6KCP8_NICAT|nr:PREDICTED: SKP1-like protein 11 [Nicotiana attenuata]XP_019232755.1 PREDICTED: SKP1-like protein 11 [Nicotiana attenuata]OIT27834.1 skp1-like protein 1b [Nicotiana attenuata]OIT27835.1 skp1-like protein 1b [Nicotiana attenuata]